MTTKASPQTQLKIEEIAGSIRVKEITSSFALEARNDGLGSSSFVSYTVGSDRPEGWTMEEARMVEAMLAQRVSKDLYADLAARKLVQIPAVASKQKAVTRQYDKLIQKLGAKACDLNEIAAAAESVENKEDADG